MKSAKEVDQVQDGGNTPQHRNKIHYKVINRRKDCVVANCTLAQGNAIEIPRPLLP